VFQPVQEQIAALRYAGTISPAEEHFMTMATQELMEEFSALVLSPSPGPIRALVTTGPGEINDTRARIIADLLEMDGFDTHFLSCPRDSIEVIESADANRSDLLLVAADPDNLAAAARMLQSLRGRLSGVKLLVDETLAAPLAENEAGCGAVDSFSNAHDALRMARALFSADQEEAYA
jgi:hypothetical protein